MRDMLKKIVPAKTTTIIIVLISANRFYLNSFYSTIVDYSFTLALTINQ